MGTTAWTTARNGRRIDLLNPTVEMIHEDDVAVSLARQSRYNAWLDIPIDDIYSIAQHSVYVGRTMYHKALEIGATMAVAKRFGRVGIAHDVPEFALKDIITPLKVHMPEYKALEAIWEPVCYEWAGAANPTQAEIDMMHWADRTVLLQEMAQFGRSTQWAVDEGWDLPIIPLFKDFAGDDVWKPSQSYRAFLGELHFLNA